jgi:uncharacterized membrane protein SpoIIM required for sporulation
VSEANGKLADPDGAERLRDLTVRAEQGEQLDREEVRELLRLYRKATGDLAEAQSRCPESRYREGLEMLVGRAYGVIYREPTEKTGASALFMERLPSAFRENAGYFFFVGGCFLFGLALGAVAVGVDERWAELFLPPAAVDGVRGGRLWTDVFGVVPGSLISAVIFFNNALVCITAFALGLLLGVGTIYVVMMNGMMLGAAATLCWRYGLAAELAGFAVGHGILEVSAILLAATGGVMLGDALVRPGPYRRLDALRMRARQAVVLAIGAIPFLLLAGLIEGFVSPGDFSDPLKYALGLSAGVVMYLHLVVSGRGRTEEALD